MDSDTRHFLVPRVYQRNPHLVGRAELIETLRNKLCGDKETFSHRLALYGLGGVGKTEIAIEYAFQFKEEYHSIFWVQATTLADLLSGFQKIAEATRCAHTIGKPAPSVAEEVLAWLERQSSWLLVLDNLDNFDDIQDAQQYFPRLNSPTNHLLITTRKPDATGIPAEAVEVPVFTTNSAAELLLLRSSLRTEIVDPKVEAEAIEIVKDLGRLPLAIEQAAAYIRECLKDLFKFRAIYAQSRKKFHERRPSRAWTYPHTVATTWLMSFDAVGKNNPHAAKLLTFLAFLNPDDILIEFLQAGKEALTGPLRAVFQQQFEFYEALGDLEQYALIRLSADRESILIHRLVQAVQRDNLHPEREIEYMQMAVALFLRAFPEFDLKIEGSRQLCRKYQNQVVLPLRGILSLYTENVASICSRVAYFLSADGKFYDCLQFKRAAINIYTHLFGVEHPNTLTSMNNLAETYRALGRANDAAALQETVLEARKRTVGDEHPHTLTSMNNLAETYRAMGRANDAAALHETVLEARKRTVGDEHPHTLLSMNNLAVTYGALGRTNGEAALQETVLEARKRTLGDEHPETLTSMNNLAVTYGALGRANDAAALQETVLEARKRTVGDEHPHTLSSMNNLAVTYYTLGRANDAAALHETVLEARKRTLGDEHPHTLLSMNNLAETYWDISRRNAATDLFEEELNICRRVYGTKHEKTLTSTRRLIEGYREMGDTENEEKLMSQLMQLANDK